MNRREFFLANLGGLALVAGVGALVSRCAPLVAVLVPARPPQIGLRGWKAGSTVSPAAEWVRNDSPNPASRKDLYDYAQGPL